MRENWTPSIVPNGHDQTVYIVLNDFGQLGRAYCEASEDRSDLETTISDLIAGQYNNLVRVIAFNSAERWSEDVSEDIARKIMRRLGLAGDEWPSSLEGFIDRHLGSDRQLTLRLPTGYRIPAHNHPTTEYVTVISGTFNLGMGDKLDQMKGIRLTAGGWAEAPAKINHYAWASSPSIVQVHGQGPFAITYVNPADDPTKQKQFRRSHKQIPAGLWPTGMSRKDGERG